jgi:beta-fructofuranosidase
VFYHPQQGDFHAFITARVNHGPADSRGVIGHARSDDLIEWQVLPPVSSPGEFGQLEVPQLVEIGGKYILLFCLASEHYAKSRLERIAKPVTGTHYLVSNNLLGPYELTTDTFLVGDETGSLYAGKIVRGPEGDWKFLATRQLAPDGTFIGEVSDPFPVTVSPSGKLSVAWTK